MLSPAVRTVRAASFTADRAWGALDLARIAGASVRLHWTDAPYHWHVNSGDEVFAVLDGVVDMHYRIGAEEQRVRLQAGDVFCAAAGAAHVAYPQGQARILVVESLHDADA
ncbi:Cupin domain-containing protein [Andreprevotia lacus DSM 23236]|jgi:mannose-6-phosphate isomerase-like protein (cupin superfamily)|uniref:Cupin domain-containing protein n=1 Tax=Andreprevotia lacus DSM 23236 TaxID=1121001 RepID=A0A1W1XAY0_9NEIS|nr:cupin domain-containing protein [Andreprevotia lacus]SMC21020.1 Cupin domain-containing protein [Andreprevotia lacus DSM 23236]